MHSYRLMQMLQLTTTQPTPPSQHPPTFKGSLSQKKGVPTGHVPQQVCALTQTMWRQSGQSEQQQPDNLCLMYHVMMVIHMRKCVHISPLQCSKYTRQQT